MGINFPNAPSVGTTWPSPPVSGQPVYTWDGEKWGSGTGYGAIYMSDTPPPGVPVGSLWYETDTGLLFVRVSDANSTQWVQIAGSPSNAVLYGTAQTLTPAQQSQARANIDVTQKNYIINGAMMVSQENGGTLGTTNTYYAVDQFQQYFGHGGAQYAQQTAIPTPGGSPNRLRITVQTADVAVAATDNSRILHILEGLRVADLCFGTAAAKTVTLQFGVYAPAGTYGVYLSNLAGDRVYVAEYVISASEANTVVVKSVTIQGDTQGTWPKDNTGSITVGWTLMCGTTFQKAAGAWSATYAFATANQFNFMATAGNVFELFDVSLTEGTVAPPFVVPDYASELLACQRYFYNAVGRTLPGWAATTGAAFGIATHPVAMRAVPTMTPASVVANYVVAFLTSGVGSTSLPNIPVTYPPNTNFSTGVQFNVTAGTLVAGQSVGLYVAGYLNFSARL